MSARFEPLGEQSRRQMVLEVLRAHQVGDVVLYSELGAVMALDPDVDRDRIQGAVNAARREYLHVDGRALDAVPNEGYRIVVADEHVRLARKKQRRAVRATAAGRDLVVKVDRNELSPEMRLVAEATGRALDMQLAYIRRLDVRQKRLEETLELVSTRQERSEEDVAARFAALEAEIAVLKAARSG